MNEQRIFWLVNDLFHDIEENDRVCEQKEELRIHLTDRVSDYMEDGLGFDEAFAKAQEDLGDLDELKSGFAKKNFKPERDADEPEGINIRFDGDDGKKRSYSIGKDIEISTGCSTGSLVSVTPFIYVGVGLLLSFLAPEGGWPWTNWWAWGWFIIPVTPIIGKGRGLLWKLPALAPFIYVVVGLLWLDWRWWAIGWLIMPLTGFIFAGVKRPKRKKKKKRKDIGEVVSHVPDDGNE